MTVRRVRLLVAGVLALSWVTAHPSLEAQEPPGRDSVVSLGELVVSAVRSPTEVAVLL